MKFEAKSDFHTNVVGMSDLSLIKWHPHRCTRVKNPGERVLEVFTKILRGSRLSGKIARGVPLF
jgi:hypothetical protein